MTPLIGNPQGTEWVIILAILGGMVLPIVLLVWVVVKLARRT